MKRAGIMIATAGGAGYAPFASGTFGAAVGVLIYWVLASRLSPMWELGVALGVSVVGVWASNVAVAHFDRDDPGQVVIDEVAGQLVTYLFLDLSLVGIILGFLLFRIFDIIKPWPARQLEDLHGGLGIVADDLMAGVYAWIVLAALTYGWSLLGG